MKNYSATVTFIIMAAIALLSFISCQKSPINDNLDGQWQIMSVEPIPSEIITSERLYICFSLHTCHLSQYGGIWTGGNMKYDKSAELLHLDFPYAKGPVSIARLKQYGINRNPVTFSIEHLDKKSLILRDGETVVTLRKF